jgi:hypothetical protein
MLPIEDLFVNVCVLTRRLLVPAALGLPDSRAWARSGRPAPQAAVLGHAAGRRSPRKAGLQEAVTGGW